MKYIEAVITWHQLTNMEMLDLNIQRYVNYYLDMEATSNPIKKLALMARYYGGGAGWTVLAKTTHAALLASFVAMMPVVALLEIGLRL